MRLAVFGDIHANLEALQAMTADADSEGCTEYACTGDVVGYNADPNECADMIRAMGCPIVRGNHDEDAAGDHPLVGLSPKAHHALTWTREVLNSENRNWLANLPYVIELEAFTLVHATLNRPQGWGYVMNTGDAAASFRKQAAPLCFHGHTHIPIIYDAGEFAINSHRRLARILPGHRYLCNVGSVGKPRESDQRATYAIYDDEARTVAIRRVDYDIEAARRKSRAAGLIE